MTNSRDGTVSVINSSTLAVVATIPVGVFPDGVAVNASGSQAYVSNFNGNSLSVIDTASNAVVKTVTVGDHPAGVVEVGGKVYVANLLSGTASVVDPVAGTVTATITLGGNAAPSGLAASGGRLYASDARNGKTIVVDLATNGVLGSVATGVHPAYLSLAGARGYVASPGDNSVKVLNTTPTPPTAVTSVGVGTAPYGVVAAPVPKLVLATNSGSNNLSVIDATTNAVIGSPVALGTTPDAIALSPDGQTAYVSNEGSNTATVLHVNQPPVARPVAFSGAVGNTVFGVGTSPAKPSSSVSGTVLSNSTDPEGNPLTAVAGTFATAQGGLVVLNADGTFIYTPAVGFVGDDTFSFTVSDGGSTTSTATATIHVVNRVWYVRNNDAGANDGRSVSPFHTLAQAQTASSAGDYIFVFKGDGTSAGQNGGIALKANQKLIGEAQSLVVGTATLFTGTPASRPLLTASTGSVVVLADGATVAGVAINPTGTAIGISGGSAITSGATVNDVTIASSADADGIALTDAAGTVAVTNTTVAATTGVTSTQQDAMRVTAASGTLTLTLTGDSFAENSANGNDALNVTTSGSAVVNPTITNTKFTAARGDLFQLNVGDTSSSTLVFTGNTLSNNNPNIVSGGGGVTITAGGGLSPAATLSFDIENNTFRDALGNAVAIGNGSGGNSVSGKFLGNTVGVAGVPGSGSLQGGDLSVASTQGGSIALRAENNSFYEYSNAFGVDFQLTGTTSLNAKFDHNTIAQPNSLNRSTGLFLNSGTTTGDTNSVCFDAFSNNVAGAGSNGNFDILYRQRQTTTVRLPGYAGSATDPAAVAGFAIAQNSPPTPTAHATVNGTGFAGGGPCSTP
ncbi:MAG: Ig-like domain-containing protein [Solirubrobacteraceae bacterium]